MACQDNSTSCPVAATAREIVATVRIMERAETAKLRAPTADQALFERRHREAAAQIAFLEDRMAHEAIGGAEGALGAVLLAFADVASLADASEDTVDQRYWRRVQRLLYAVVDYLEDASGTRREDLGADFYMGREFDPRAVLLLAAE